MEDRNINVNISGWFTGLLTIAFIVLKLCGVIDWAWIWVFAPLWIPIAVVVGVYLIVLVFSMIFALIASKFD